MKTLCPSGHTLNVPDAMQGKKIRCKTCQQVFVVGTASPYVGGLPPAAPPGRHPPPSAAHYPPPPAPYPSDLEDDEAGFGGPGNAVRENWQGVKVGLLLYQIRYIIMACVCGGGLLQLLLIIISGLAGSLGLLMLVGIVQIILGVASLGAYILGLVGAIFCIQIPPRTGYRGLAIALTSLEGAVVGLGLLAVVFLLALRSPVVYVLLVILAGLTALAAFIVFILFLRGVALCNKQRTYAGRTIVMMIMYLVAPVVYLILFGITYAIAYARVNPRIPGIMLIVFTAALLGFELYLHLAISFLVKQIRGGAKGRKKPALARGPGY